MKKLPICDKLLLHPKKGLRHSEGGKPIEYILETIQPNTEINVCVVRWGHLTNLYRERAILEDELERRQKAVDKLRDFICSLGYSVDINNYKVKELKDAKD